MITSSAEEMNPSRRNTMEDCHMTHSPGTWGCDDAETTFLAICDGHGGRDIVEFLEQTLAKNVADELNVIDNASIHERLERAFLITDIQSHMMKIDTSGATVVLCLIKKQPDKVVIHAANAGDARAVLSCTPCRIHQHPSPQHPQTQTDNEKNSWQPKESTAYRLTCDHRADDPIEQSRIEKAGGFVTRNRVLGILAVGRSLGDHGMKEFVIGTPFVNSVEIDLEDSLDDVDYPSSITIDEKQKCGRVRTSRSSGSEHFVIVGCDGLWDVIEDQDAVNQVRDFLLKGGKKEEVAQMLCNIALRRGSTDNITVVVTWL